MRTRAALPLLLAVAGLAACGEGRPAAQDTVLRLEGDEIPYPAFEAYLDRSLGESGAGLPSEVLSRLFDQFVDEKLLARLASDEGVGDPSAPRTAINQLLERRQADDRPGREEIEAYYREHRADFDRPERILLQQILVEDRATAERALEALARGREFAELAEEISIAPVASFLSDQQGLARQDLPPIFADEIFDLKAGEISGIVAADYGFHIFKILERLPERRLTLEEATPEVRAQLARQRQGRLLAELVEDARKRYNPVVYESNLPFNYRGRYGDAIG